MSDRIRLYVAHLAPQSGAAARTIDDLRALGFAVAASTFGPDPVEEIADDLAVVEQADLVAYMPGAEEAPEVNIAQLWRIPVVPVVALIRVPVVAA
jgi:hypothetical protein